MATTKTEHRIRGRLEPETFERYQKTKETLGLAGTNSDEQCVHALLEKFDQQPIAISPSTVLALLYPTDSPITEAERDRRAQEQADIADALQLEHVRFWDLLRHALVREARLAKSHAAKLQTVVLNGDVKQPMSGVQGAAHARIKQCVDTLMAQNLAQDHAMDIVYITGNIVQKATGCAINVIAQYFREHAHELEAHHQSLGFGSQKAGFAHNQKRVRYQKERRETSHVPIKENGGTVDEK